MELSKNLPERLVSLDLPFREKSWRKRTDSGAVGEGVEGRIHCGRERTSLMCLICLRLALLRTTRLSAERHPTPRGPLDPGSGLGLNRV